MTCQQKMCDVCCKEFKGWCKSFTRTEAVLSVLEATLLILFVGLLAFLILHFIVCKGPSIDISTTTPKTTVPSIVSSESSTKAIKSSPDSDCTWTPSKKTEAPTRYFEFSGQSYETTSVLPKEATKTENVQFTSSPFHDITMAEEDSDGVDPESVYKSVVLALVKTRPQQDIVFGCILTIVSEYWTLTAASCIESIEEVDSLDSFVIMESYGELANGATHAVADVQINPFYKGTNKSYDLAALRSDASLTKKNGKPVVLPQPLDYLLITVGERFTILGYGKFRTVTDKVLGRSLREVHVHGVPSVQCAGDEDTWAPKHLWGGAPAAAGSGAGAGCGAAALCAGPLYARGLPCNYCAGTPLLAGRLLLAVMAESAQCGVACEPTLYVNLAAARDWLESVIESD